jgi:hypothetical protein
MSLYETPEIFCAHLTLLYFGVVYTYRHQNDLFQIINNIHFSLMATFLIKKNF